MGAGRSSVEDLVIDQSFWAGRSVFITGHTGFKGAWMSLLLSQLGARVSGFALAPENGHDLFAVADVERDVRHRIGDVRDLSELRKAVGEAQPTVVFHMAAQALVRSSYQEPVTTYETNVMGTVNLLEVVRHAPEVQAVVVVTSDKCYDNREWPWGYRETDRLGGRDPYSNSKACAELVTAAYRSSFFEDNAAARIATARAGNVIGGGDWARDRLIPDAMRAFMAREPLLIRNPRSIRPWQHVLDPVAAYLLLAERLVTGARRFEGSWNFGPSAEGDSPVEYIASQLVHHWGNGSQWERDETAQQHEATSLKLDCSKARAQLGWRPMFDLNSALRQTVEWYRAYEAGSDMRAITLAQISQALNSGAARAIHP